MAAITTTPLVVDNNPSLLEMTSREARHCIEAINAHMAGARMLIKDLYDRQGWRALGYASWRECVVAEFEQSQAYLYRQLSAAQVETNISPIGEIGTIPESHLRPLSPLEPEEQRTVWELAVTSADTMEEAVTAALVAVSAKIAQQQQGDLPSGVKAILDTKDPQVVQKVIQEYTAQKTIPKRIPAVLPAESPLARPNDAPLQKDDAEYRGPQTQDEAAALWVHGRMLEFEKKGYLTPGFTPVIFNNMHSNQRQDATRLVQSILQFFYELGVLLNESATKQQ